MADLLHLEDTAKRCGATTVEVPMKAAKRKDPDTGEKPEVEFSVHVPKTLSDAVEIEGEDQVFKRYIDSLAIAIQAVKRRELEGEVKKSERKRAPYRAALGL